MILSSEARIGVRRYGVLGSGEEACRCRSLAYALL